MKEKLALKFPRSLGNYLPYSIKRNLCLQPLAQNYPPLSLPLFEWPKSVFFILPSNTEDAIFCLPIIRHYLSKANPEDCHILAPNKILQYLKGFFNGIQLWPTENLFVDHSDFRNLLEKLVSKPPEACFCLTADAPLRLLRIMGQCPTALRASIGETHHPFASTILPSNSPLRAMTRLLELWQMDGKSLYGKTQLQTAALPIPELLAQGVDAPPFMAVFFWNPYLATGLQSKWLLQWMNSLSTHNASIKQQIIIADGSLAEKSWKLPKKWASLRAALSLPMGKTLSLLDQADTIAGGLSPALALGHLARKKVQLFGVKPGSAADARWLFPTVQIELG